MGIPSRIHWSYFIASRNQIFLLKTVSFENFSSTRFILYGTKERRPKILNEIAHKYLNNHKFHGMSERIRSILIWWMVGLQMFHIFFLSFDETFNLSLIILPKVQRMWFRKLSGTSQRFWHWFFSWSINYLFSARAKMPRSHSNAANVNHISHAQCTLRHNFYVHNFFSLKAYK